MTYDQWYEKYVKGNAKAEAQEKATKNSASDREQYERYQKVLGKEIPKVLQDSRKSSIMNLRNGDS